MSVQARTTPPARAERGSRSVALVTGAASGIGAAIAQSLAAAGFSVVATDIEAVSSTADARLTCRAMDVRNREAIGGTAQEVEALFGRLDVLVNNAGIFGQTPALDLDEELMRRIVDVNLLGTLRCTAAFGALMARHGGGRIVNLASVSGIGGAALASVYAATKGGMIAATRSAARELAPHGITVNAVAPGYCDTGMMDPHRAMIERFVVPRIPLKRVATAQEVADVVMFLAKDAPTYQTGSVITLDGGITSG